mmetsp:Transcript_38431/g.81992  ORF Transcript_38431/g.81992 Transcript_38431/m.81992 type:complete len:116 (+) Transcript_38431:511-858(+)
MLEGVIQAAGFTGGGNALLVRASVHRRRNDDSGVGDPSSKIVLRQLDQHIRPKERPPRGSRVDIVHIGKQSAGAPPPSAGRCSDATSRTQYRLLDECAGELQMMNRAPANRGRGE